MKSLEAITLKSKYFTQIISYVFVVTIYLSSTSCATQSTDKVNDMEKKVINLISMLSIDEENQRKALIKLLNLSCDYAPYIINNMDDRRKIPHRFVAFKNEGPGHFEGYRHVNVNLVVDALDALLNQKIGLIGYNYDPEDGTDEDRKLAVEGWKAILNKYNGNLCPQE